MENKNMVFGPIPSRRLGRSLGINNIPPKICSYSCVYCQLGRTVKLREEPSYYYSPNQIFNQVAQRVEQIQKANEKVDYLTFVPNGEPTLDSQLGEEIDLLKSLHIPIAVITNSSLLWREDVRNALKKAECVSVKIDTMTETIWRKINRPHKQLKLSFILAGILTFAQEFPGMLVTETMLVKGLNDTKANIRQISEFVPNLKPGRAYLSIPTRPPAEKSIESPDEESLLSALAIVKERISNVELLTGYEGNEFAATGNAETDLLSITAVHPMREEAVESYLNRFGKSWEVINKLISENKLVVNEYKGHKYYLRNLSRN